MFKNYANFTFNIQSRHTLTHNFKTESMKKVFITLTLCALVLFSVMGQENYYKYDNYIRVAGNIGLSASTEHNEKIGIGGEITWLTGDNLFLLNRNNFVILILYCFA